jgi:Transposase IS66 family
MRVNFHDRFKNQRLQRKPLNSFDDGRCRRSKKAMVKGSFPEDMPGRLQYGNGLKAFAIHLIISQMVALNRVQKQISAMMGMVISDAHNLWGRLQEHETAVLLFAKDPHVPFTNNRAERDLRMAKVKQKVSGCFRSEQYARAYCRISSYLQTMAAQGVNPLVAIQLALANTTPGVEIDMG